MTERSSPVPRARHRAPSPALPAGTTDCHMHVFGPAARYPWAERRAYTPPDATLDAYLAMAAQVGIERVVLVQPTVYGADNRAILDAMATLGPARARGVAGIGSATTDEELRSLASAGIRGVRLVTHPRVEPAATAERLNAVARRLAPHGLHLELLVGPALLGTLEDVLAALPVDLVIDHVAQVSLAEGPAQAGFHALLRLLGRGRSWVKLSGLYRLGGAAAADQGASLPFLHRLGVEARERLVWGSDWPHTSDRIGGDLGPASRVEFRDLDVGDMLGFIAAALPGGRDLQAILVDNPGRLFGFPAAAARPDS
jgi:predicted TIM-barrel fold metal-dependent hydrolase